MLTILPYPIDGGPVYAETDLSHTFAEPWNSISSLSFVLTGLYFIYLTKGSLKSYGFILFASTLLILGGIGSTLYHAFRTSSYLLMLDVLPIAILSLSVSVYFLTKVLRYKWLAPVIILPFLGFRFLLFYSEGPASPMISNLPRQSVIAVSYFISGVMIFVPAIIFCVKTKGRFISLLVMAIILLIISLIFRETDHSFQQFFKQGSHWLWHVFSALGAGFLGSYLYKTSEKNL